MQSILSWQGMFYTIPKITKAFQSEGEKKPIYCQQLLYRSSMPAASSRIHDVLPLQIHDSWPVSLVQRARRLSPASCQSFSTLPATRIRAFILASDIISKIASGVELSLAEAVTQPIEPIAKIFEIPVFGPQLPQRLTIMQRATWP